MSPRVAVAALSTGQTRMGGEMVGRPTSTLQYNLALVPLFLAVTANVLAEKQKPL